MNRRGRQLLKWAVIICLVLLVPAALAGAGLPPASLTGCSLVSCQCHCCQPGHTSRCKPSSASHCGCPVLPGLNPSHFNPAAEGGADYQPVLANPASKLFILTIYHPPENQRLSSS